MRSNRLFKLIVAIGTMALAIAPTFNAGAAAPRYTSADKAPLDQHDRHPSLASEAVTAFDVEQARISWRTTAPAVPAQGDTVLSVSSEKGRRSTGITLDQQTRDAIQARWLTQHGGTHRTCVLLCGGR